MIQQRCVGLVVGKDVGHRRLGVFHAEVDLATAGESLHPVRDQFAQRGTGLRDQCGDQQPGNHAGVAIASSARMRSLMKAWPVLLMIGTPPACCTCSMVFQVRRGSWMILPPGWRASSAVASRPTR
ncbi:hypothetical protein G6F50_016760 [Rhizopus delemar]|uniref:Uncharacterized protein n=1 Tax=Rhizopus delemar TaxID=936053 RepID=A0A9P7C168_9FUNG|nr:hypothetical protein G6F50_016760 [Rhizopus delemar]